MTIESQCPTCGDIRRVPEGDMGRAYLCAKCHMECIVPSVNIHPGTKLGAFTVIRPLGAGATSEVHLAEDGDGRKAALKILFTADSDREVDEKRFKREVAHASQLHHPCLIEIYDIGYHEDHLFIAMEFIEGDTVENILDDHGELPEPEVLVIARDVADALRYAWHEVKMVHRDIKPGNIIISFEGNPKLMDLGIARSRLDENQTRLTAADTVIGSPPYMSPEQCHPGREVTFHSDIYSLGASLFHMLTNEFPFYGETALDTIKMHLTRPVPDPRKHQATISADTAMLVMRMMAKSVRDRPQSWGEVIAELDRILGQ